MRTILRTIAIVLVGYVVAGTLSTLAFCASVGRPMLCVSTADVWGPFIIWPYMDALIATDYPAPLVVVVLGLGLVAARLTRRPRS